MVITLFATYMCYYTKRAEDIWIRQLEDAELKRSRREMGYDMNPAVMESTLYYDLKLWNYILFDTGKILLIYIYIYRSNLVKEYIHGCFILISI